MKVGGTKQWPVPDIIGKKIHERNPKSTYTRTGPGTWLVHAPYLIIDRDIFGIPAGTPKVGAYWSAMWHNAYFRHAAHYRLFSIISNEMFHSAIVLLPPRLAVDLLEYASIRGLTIPEAILYFASRGLRGYQQKGSDPGESDRQ